MVSGTLKIHQNQWRVIQNQGSLENVKIASEVASRCNFDAISVQLWLQSKRNSWKSVQKKEPPKSQMAPGADKRKAGWLPERPPSRTRFSNKKQLFEQLLGIVLDLLRKQSESVQQK